MAVFTFTAVAQAEKKQFCTACGHLQLGGVMDWPAVIRGMSTSWC